MSGPDLSRLVDETAPDDAPALTFFGGDASTAITLTYGDLQARVTTVAAVLQHKGLPAGAAIGILAENQLAHFIAYLGIQRGGYVAVPINQKLGEGGILHILEDAGIHLCFTDMVNGALLPPNVETVLIDGAEIDLPLVPDTWTPFSPKTDHWATIMYTSGSTGTPKGVPITHAGYRWAMERFEFLRPVITSGPTFVAAPLYHMNAQFHLKSILMVGGHAVLLPRFEATLAWAALDAFDLARLTGVPTMFELLLRERPAAKITSVQSIGVGSAPLSETLLKRLEGAFPNAVISNGYGTTEIGPAVFGPHPDGRPTPPLSIGYPMAGVEIRLVDGEGPDQGTLLVKTGMQTPGYLHRPDLNEKAFEDGWYNTRDVMRCDEDGFFYFDSRSDDMFVCGGENIFPGEVETRLLSHPLVEEAAVVPLPDSVKGALPVAFVIVQSPTSEEGLKQHTLALGPAYAHPRYIAFLDAMPLNGVNKVDKKKLTALAEEQFGGLRA